MLKIGIVLAAIIIFVKITLVSSYASNVVEKMVWPGNRVYYQFGHFSNKTWIKYVANNTMALFDEYFPKSVTWIYQENVTDIDRYISFVPGFLNTQNCGQVINRGPSIVEVTLKKVPCDYMDALHELLHALGFVHEHSRWDRNSWIKINFDNVKPHLKYRVAQNFQLCYDCQNKTEAAWSHYDQCSLLHYLPFVDPWVINKSIALWEPVDEFSPKTCPKKTLTHFDKEKILLVYGPPEPKQKEIRYWTISITIIF